mgnify:CR=1 FL=1
MDKAKETIGKLIPSEYVSSMSSNVTDAITKTFGKAADKICEKPGIICFEKKRLGLAIVILIIIAILLSIIAMYMAYHMGKKYVEVNSTEQVVNEPYIDAEGEAYNF